MSFASVQWVFIRNFNMNKRLNSSIKMYKTSPKTHHNRNMMKEFTPPKLRLLGAASNGLGLSIMLKNVTICVYNLKWFWNLLQWVQNVQKLLPSLFLPIWLKIGEVMTSPIFPTICSTFPPKFGIILKICSLSILTERHFCWKSGKIFGTLKCPLTLMFWKF